MNQMSDEQISFCGNKYSKIMKNFREIDVFLFHEFFRPGLLKNISSYIFFLCRWMPISNQTQTGLGKALRFGSSIDC